MGPYRTNGTYRETFGSTSPGCIIFMVDQSDSMNDPFGGIVEGIERPMKKDAVADVINRAIHEIQIVCTVGETIRDRVYLAIIGYGAQVGSAFGGAIQNRDLVSISEVAKNPVRVENRIRRESDGTGGIVEVPMLFPIWLEPRAGNQTPMYRAFEMAYNIVEKWCNENPNSHPPIIANITDGLYNEGGDPAPVTDRISQIRTNDGNVTIFNCHIAKSDAASVKYPSSEEQLPALGTEEFKACRFLFNISSYLPQLYVGNARTAGANVRENSVGMLFNAHLTDLTVFITWVTRGTLDRGSF